MTRLLGIGLLTIAWLASLSTVACGGQAEAEKIGAAAVEGVEMDIDPETTGNSASAIGPGGVENCYRVDVEPAKFGDGVADHTVDVVVTGDTQAPVAYDAWVNYDPTLVHIVNPTDVVIKLTCAPEEYSEGRPDSDGTYMASEFCLTGEGIAGDGTLVRLSIDVQAAGVVTFSLEPPPGSAYASDAGTHAVNTDAGWLAINEDCTEVPPTPSPTATPTPTTSPGTPAPATVAPTPPPGTIALVSGWNNSCYVGAEQPIGDALADIADQVVAVYRMRPGQGFDRWFPTRPDVSTIADVSAYEPLFILMGQQAFWAHEPFGTPPTSISLVSGWNNVCYTGQTKSAEDAAAGVAGGFGIMYQLGSDQVWSRYVPARPEVSNIVQLGQYDSVLVLVDREGGTSWTFDP